MLCPKCGSDLGPTTGMPSEQIFCVKCKKWIPTNAKPRTVQTTHSKEKKELIFTPKVTEYTDATSTDL